MEYIFKLDFYTDGDFDLEFVPRGMVYDGGERYWFEKRYTIYDNAVEDIKKICNFIKNNITGRDGVVENVKNHLDTFIDSIDKNTDERISDIFAKDKFFRVNTSMYGNYEGTEFTFRAAPKKVNFDFYLTEEEEKLFNKNAREVTYGDIKKAVMELFRDKE